MGLILQKVKPIKQLASQRKTSKGCPGRSQVWFKNTEELSCQVPSPLKVPETEVEMVPELCPDQDGLDAHGIQSSGPITKNPGDN